MEIEDILKIVSVIATSGLLIYAWKKFHSKTLWLYFTVMIVLFLLPMVSPFGENRADTWIKHIMFYSGQFCMYVFLTHLIETFTFNSSEEKPAVIAPPTITKLAPIALINTSAIPAWFDYLTDQGLEHFMVLPLFFLIFTVIRIRYQYITNAAFRAALRFCLLAGFALGMIHVGEFVVESQHWLSFMEGEPIEISEFFWFFVSLTLFWVSIKKLPNEVHQPAL